MRVTFVDNLLLEPSASGFKFDLQPHLGLISLTAVLRNAGHVATIVDPKRELAAGRLALAPGFYGAVAESIAATQPDVAGFTSLGCNFVCTVKIAQSLRSMRPKLPIVLGGPHATILDREIMERYPAFDAVVRNEAETSVTATVESLAAGRAPHDVEGVTFRHRDRIVRTKDAGPILDLDSLPFPAYDAYPIEQFGLTSLAIDAGRGCPFRCSFCSTASFFGRRYRLKSAGRLVAEMDRLAETYGVTSFNLSHDLFTVNKLKIREFCEAVAPRHFRWGCSARMDCVDDALLAEMQRAGCASIYYGVETGSGRMQKVVQKDLDLSLYHPRLTKTLDLGMTATASFITGYPGETPADQDETLELIGESLMRYGPALNLQLHLLTPEPGTAMLANHRETLAYDGHVTDFNFPTLEPDDAEVMAADPETFVCHHYYADERRADNVEVTEAFRQLYPLGGPFLARLRREGETFSALVRAYGHFCRRSRASGKARVVDFVRSRLGNEHPLYDAARYVATRGELAREPRRAVLEPHQSLPLQLGTNVGLLPRMRDGVEVLERLQTGLPYDEPLPLEFRLLLATPDIARLQLVRVDYLTYRIARRLRRISTAADLASRFGRGPASRRLEALCLLGAVVEASN
jgi:radical SAM superfamily enzyme YgiQ (UPF0313 family)